ncbi:GrpB family protein [Aquimarina hainanensis]|uniref:GrpB family protein n=1 Tax=Aquimarina hainanensis TaxID=1578017 RepID=A0ABW5N4B1_9FLAO|nr:GrpB family protein [Aquimarina sp. TRL1]QKX04845.1 GrpB family protein [Aquimarina sp. TRL1]
MKKDELTVEEWGMLFPVIIRPHKKEWNTNFLQEKKLLEKILPDHTIKRIEHCGSTSIDGVCSKDVIDVIIGIPEEKVFDPEVISQMKKYGYRYFKQEKSHPHYMIFVKGFECGEGAEQRFFIHMTTLSHEEIWERIFFRDYLRTHPDIAEEYGRLKVELATKFATDRISYRKAKTAFVMKITHKAKTASKW